MALFWPREVRVVPSMGSTAMSTAGPPAPISSPLKSIGASSFSPSPMTTMPSIGTEFRTRRIASTAAPSAPFLSPRPNQRPPASAAASVARARSMARLRSGGWGAGSIVRSYLWDSRHIPPGASGSGLEFGDHVLAQQLDRPHHRRVRDLVRVEEAEQQVAVGGVVATGGREARLGAADDARARRLQIVEREQRQIEILEHLGVVVRAERLALLPLGDGADVPQRGAHVPLEGLRRLGEGLLVGVGTVHHRERGGLRVDELADRLGTG